MVAKNCIVNQNGLLLGWCGAENIVQYSIIWNKNRIRRNLASILKKMGFEIRTTEPQPKITRSYIKKSVFDKKITLDF